MPAGLQLDIEVFGTQILNRRLLRFAGGVSDASLAFEAVARILSAATARNFATSGASGGHPWRALAPATLARKRRLGLDPRILRATGRLYSSLVDATSPDHVQQITTESLRWGSTVDYGKYHQSTRPRAKVPYRPPVAFSENAKRNVVRELQRALIEDALA